MLRRLAAALFLLAAASSGSGREARPDLQLHALFADGMVLQRDLPCPVWGTAAPGAKVTVSIAGKSATAKAGADGRWSVRLDPLPAGGPHEMKVNQLTVRDVLVGEVWLAAGGSNMQMPLKAALRAETDADEGDGATRRFFVVPPRRSEAPERQVQASWRSNRSETIGDVSAVAYFFSRQLQRRLKVPVGILQACVEDSYLFQWIAGGALDSNPALRGATFYQRLSQEYYRLDHDTWAGKVRKAEEARKRGDPVPPVPPEPVNTWALSIYYNGMIAPLIPYAIRGTVFYQGEVEAHLSDGYKSFFPALIRNWRQDWGLGELPFGYVQLAGFGSRSDEPVNGILSNFRDVQARALQLPGTGMAAAVDLGDPTNALPRNKEEVGRRLAIWAEARVYGKSDLVYSGPVFDSMKVERNKVRIKFKNVGGGLKLAGDKLSGFTIASDFRRFVWAHAAVDGESVVVWNDEYEWPVAVRYAWEDNPECSLYNKEGLPALPFRTDKW